MSIVGNESTCTSHRWDGLFYLLFWMQFSWDVADAW